MGMKPRKSRKRTYNELEEGAQAMGTCLVWALKYMKPTGSGEGVVVMTATGETQAWTEKFMDALDKVGYVVDREKFYASREKNKRKRR